MLYLIDIKNNEHEYVRYAVEELIRILNNKVSFKLYFTQGEAGNYAFKSLMDTARCLIHNAGYRPSDWGAYTDFMVVRDSNDYDTIVIDGIKEYFVIEGEIIRLHGTDFTRNKLISTKRLLI